MSKQNEDGSFIPTATFKMPKQVKRTMATIVSKELRDHWKNVSIQSTLASLEVPVKKGKKK